jgi:hypothetical protein
MYFDRNEINCMFRVQQNPNLDNRTARWLLHEFSEVQFVCPVLCLDGQLIWCVVLYFY